MSYIKKIFDDNFMQYASYVIKDRAIPDIADGLKPVQRRILHSLFEMDDGKYHKVANVVGHCMKYHPHGDASIYSALVVLANKELFIDKQGNFGNLYTGDQASAARYIECRVNALAKDIFFKPKITSYIDSYDGRNKEPECFPAKVPVVLLTGAEGIAVGMSTKILPHNAIEVIKAEIACLQGKRFSLVPDFPTGGIIDASAYEDGNGKVRVRAKLDISDPKRIVIREIPFGSTTESIIASIEKASRANRIKIAGISDFTTENVEIEIKLARGEYAQETVDALYAFTECEQSLSCNLLVIKDNFPVQMTVTDVIKDHAKQLLTILKRELDLEAKEVQDEMHARVLERIFIEERVYKAIEKMKTEETVIKAVFDGLKPFAKEIKREVSVEDIARLLRIPIRRISLFDINKANDELKHLVDRLKEIKKNLANLTDYAILFLKSIESKLKADHERKTVVTSFTMVNVKEAARRDVSLRYDGQSGYLGTQVNTGETLFQVSPYDKLLVIRKNGIYSIIEIPEKLYVDKDMQFCQIIDKESIAESTFSIVYRDKETGYPYIKRCVIETFVANRDYTIVPDGAEILYLTDETEGSFAVFFEPKPRVKVLEEKFRIEDYLVKNVKAQGVRLSVKAALKVEAASLRKRAVKKDDEALVETPKEEATEIKAKPKAILIKAFTKKSEDKKPSTKTDTKVSAKVPASKTKTVKAETKKAAPAKKTTKTESAKKKDDKKPKK